MPVKTEWLELNITSPISVDDLTLLDNVIDPTVSALNTALEITKDLLEASKLLLVEDFSPLAALQLALSTELNNLIGGLQDAGVGFTFIPPELSKLRSANENLRLLAGSVTDTFDAHRPITQTTPAQIYLVAIVLRADTEPSLLIELWNRLMDLIFNYDKYELKSLKEVGKPYENTSSGYTQMPDWSAVKLPEAIPFVGSVLDVLRQITESLVDISTVQTDLIDTGIQLMDDKLQDINNIQTLLDEIILSLEIVEAMNNSGFDILYIDGMVTQQELSNAIASSTSSLPNNSGNDISALCAMYTTTPSVGSTLKSIFAGELV